jgi:hypothetical protein
MLVFSRTKASVATSLSVLTFGATGSEMQKMYGPLLQETAKSLLNASSLKAFKLHSSFEDRLRCLRASFLIMLVGGSLVHVGCALKKRLWD